MPGASPTKMWTWSAPPRNLMQYQASAGIGERVSRLSPTSANVTGTSTTGYGWTAFGRHDLWDALRSPTLQALYELSGAARTNPHLQRQLDDCQREHAEALFAFTQLLFPEAAEWPGLRGVMDLTITSIQGGAMAGLAFGPSFDLSHTKLALVNAVEQALAEAEAWSAAHTG